MNHPHSKGRRPTPTLDPLEPRRLLSATIADRELLIDGTRRSDTIVVTMDSPKVLRVRIGDHVDTFRTKRFSHIRINAGRGDDLVTLGNDAAPVRVAASITAGDGNDTVVGGAAADSITCGAGADLASGGAGNDTVDGNAGADDLHGGDGKDLVRGGRGNDRLYDDAGLDRVFGNAGRDRYFQHDQPGQFRDQEPRDLVAPEPLLAFDHPEIAAAQPGLPTLTLNAGQWHDDAGPMHVGGMLQVGGSTLALTPAGAAHWNQPGLTTTSQGSMTLGQLSLIGHGDVLQLNPLPITPSTTGNDPVTLTLGPWDNPLTVATIQAGPTAVPLTVYSFLTLHVTIDVPATNPADPPIKIVVRYDGDKTAIVKLPPGTTVTQPDGTTTTLESGHTAPATPTDAITLPDGQTLTVTDGWSLTLNCDTTIPEGDVGIPYVPADTTAS